MGDLLYLPILIFLFWLIEPQFLDTTKQLLFSRHSLRKIPWKDSRTLAMRSTQILEIAWFMGLPQFHHIGLPWGPGKSKGLSSFPLVYHGDIWGGIWPKWAVCSTCLPSWHQIRKCWRFAYPHTGFSYAHIFYNGLRWLTRARVFLTPQPRGPLPWTQGFRMWLKFLHPGVSPDPDRQAS